MPPVDELRDVLFIVIGFGLAVTMTGLATMGLIEFAQSIGWWGGVES